MINMYSKKRSRSDLRDTPPGLLENQLPCYVPWRQKKGTLFVNRPPNRLYKDKGTNGQKQDYTKTTCISTPFPHREKKKYPKNTTPKKIWWENLPKPTPRKRTKRYPQLDPGKTSPIKSNQKTQDHHRQNNHPRRHLKTYLYTKH